MRNPRRRCLDTEVVNEGQFADRFDWTSFGGKYCHAEYEATDLVTGPRGRRRVLPKNASYAAKSLEFPRGGFYWMEDIGEGVTPVSICSIYVLPESNHIL